MQVVPGLAAAHEEQRDLGLLGEPAGKGREGRLGESLLVRRRSSMLHKVGKSSGEARDLPKVCWHLVAELRQEPKVLDFQSSPPCPLCKCLLYFISEITWAKQSTAFCAPTRKLKGRILCLTKRKLHKESVSVRLHFGKTRLNGSESLATH